MILRQSDRALADLIARAGIRALLDEGDDIGECGDCGRFAPIHPDSDEQRGEAICFACAKGGAFDE